jgi:hypothetical protein
MVLNYFMHLRSEKLLIFRDHPLVLAVFLAFTSSPFDLLEAVK